VTLQAVPKLSCSNVTGDGALTLMLTGYAEKHGIKNNDNIQSPVL